MEEVTMTLAAILLFILAALAAAWTASRVGPFAR